MTIAEYDLLLRYGKTLTWFAIIVVLVASVALARGQQSPERSELLSRLHSDDWKQRAAAVQRLIAKPEALGSDAISRIRSCYRSPRERAEVTSARAMKTLLPQRVSTNVSSSCTPGP